VSRNFSTRKLHDRVELPQNLPALHPKDGAVQEDVLPPRKLRMKPGPHLQQASHAPVQVHLAGGGLRDAGKDLEQGALAGSVASDDADHVALLDVQVHVFQGPEGLPLQPLERMADAVSDGLAQGGVLFLPVDDAVGLSQPPDPDGDVGVCCHASVTGSSLPSPVSP